jgi:hypothetical protein
MRIELPLATLHSANKAVRMPLVLMSLLGALANSPSLAQVKQDGHDATRQAIAHKTPSGDWQYKTSWPSQQLMPMGHLGLAVECLFFEALQSRGHLRGVSAAELSALPSSKRHSIRTSLRDELGQNLYDRFPWILFAGPWKLSRLVWQKNESGLLDPLQIYATLQDWTIFAERISNSAVCKIPSNFVRGEWDQGIVWNKDFIVIRALMPKAPGALSNQEWIQMMERLSR